jgi:hypothetical protein
MSTELQENGGHERRNRTTTTLLDCDTIVVWLPASVTLVTLYGTAPICRPNRVTVVPPVRVAHSG